MMYIRTLPVQLIYIRAVCDITEFLVNFSNAADIIIFIDIKIKTFDQLMTLLIGGNRFLPRR